MKIRSTLGGRRKALWLRLPICIIDSIRGSDSSFAAFDRRCGTQNTRELGT